jgi:hypothetical protein
MKEPKGRYVTGKAISFLAREFNYPDWMQDWEHIVADYKDINRYFETYMASTDDDIRFALMALIVETSNEGWDVGWIAEIWPKVKQLLTDNFWLHEYTIYYWCYSLSNDIEDMFLISPYMRDLWKELTGDNFVSTYDETDLQTENND